MKRRKERMLDKARLAREERSTTVNRKLTNGNAITSTHGAVAYVELQPGVNRENVVSNPTHLVAPLASITHILIINECSPFPLPSTNLSFDLSRSLSLFRAFLVKVPRGILKKRS
jgi:hypothetical protein